MATLRGSFVPSGADDAEIFISLSEAKACSMAEPEETRFTRFNCPNCSAQYKVVKVEAPALANVEEVTCVNCGAALQARDGKFVLKYFLVGPKAKRDRRKR
jgi:predicted Zn finger-like uncharacterized protein